MVTPLTRPTNLRLPFAATGAKNTIPLTATGSNLASYPTGFPPVCSLPLTSGGIPPEGDDFNGILFNLSAHTAWVNSGGQYQYDAALSTYIGGYPKGTVLQNDAGTASYISTIDNNGNNFNSDLTSIGVSWVPYAGSAFSGITINSTGGVVGLTAVQATASVIVITGALTSDLNISPPATSGKYLFVNKTSGAYTVTVRITGQTGVPIRSGYPELIYCDGTTCFYQQNTGVTQSAATVSTALATCNYATREASRVGGHSTDTGSTANAYVIVTVPASPTLANGQTVRFTTTRNNTSTTCTLDAGFGARPLVRGDGSGPRPNDIVSGAVITATFIASANRWVINGLIIPDTILTRLVYINSTQTLANNSYNIDTSAGPFGCNLISTPVVGDSVEVGDYNGSWALNPFTLVATGGYVIKCITKNGTVWSDTTLIDNVRGHHYTVYFNGTDWELS